MSKDAEITHNIPGLSGWSKIAYSEKKTKENDDITMINDAGMHC